MLILANIGEVFADFGDFGISVIGFCIISHVFTVRTKTFTNKSRRSNQSTWDFQFRHLNPSYKLANNLIKVVIVITTRYPKAQLS